MTLIEAQAKLSVVRREELLAEERFEAAQTELARQKRLVSEAIADVAWARARGL
jgi:hypothetical protein